MQMPFHCGAQAGDWIDHNCMRCSKSSPDECKDCEIERAIGSAWFGGGEVTNKIAKRMGFYGNEISLGWDCPERKLR